MSYTTEDDLIIYKPTNYVPNEKGMGWTYFESMKKFKDNVAQYIVGTDEHDTFGELLQRSVRVSLNISQQFDLNKDDVILLCTDNHKNSCVPMLASFFLGLQVACLDPSLDSYEMGYYLKNFNPRLVFVNEQALETVEESLSNQGYTGDIIVFGQSNSYQTFDDLLKPHEDEETFTPAPIKSLDDPLLIIFTSGSTGLSKGTVINHYTVGVQTFYALESAFTNSVYLSYSTFFWVSGFYYLTMSLMSGFPRVICSRYDPRKIWHLIDKYKVTSLFLIPTQAVLMMEARSTEPVNASSLRSFVLGGTAISGNFLKQLRSFFPGTAVFQTYGMSETCGSVLRCSSKETYSKLCQKPNSVGLPFPGVRYKVVDPESGKVCGPHQPGELRIKSRMLMNGYYKTNSSDAYDADGWFKTGDILYYDEEKFFYFVGRKKELIKFRGYHISPAIIETVLMDHPAVQQSAVIGLPSQIDEDHPMAIIVLNEKYKDITTEEEIENFVSERLNDRMKLRGGVEFVDSLPTTPTGKVRRYELREKILKEKIDI